LLESPIYAFIDSTIAELWLPLSACKRFEKTFDLEWDHQSQLYLVNDTLHSRLLATNPNITLSLSPAPSGGPLIQITLPYAAFDLTAKPPYQGINSTSLYFPLRRALNDTQYTLGRTFLQEAYLTVDWERQNFSVSQVNWTVNAPQHLVPILSVKEDNASVSNNPPNLARMNNATIAGIVTSSAVFLAIIAVLSYLLYRSNNHRRAKEAEAAKIAKKMDDTDKEEPKPNTLVTKAELDASEDVTRKVFEKDTFYQPCK
jgi:hypothetical protein